jgi:RimJ/RimL family protein N-acetyltransferase
MSDSARVRLERIGLARAKAIVAGDYSGLVAGPGWPHDDTLDGIQLAAQFATTDEETGFLVVLVATGEVIGDAGWHGGPDAAGAVEIGFGLAAPFRGRGLGTETVRAVRDWARSQPGVATVLAEALESNIASRRALEAAGFELERTTPPTVLYVDKPVLPASVTGE